MGGSTNRAVALIDGMNLYNHALRAFGDRDGRYDPAKLARSVADIAGCDLVQTRFYVGVPSANVHRRLNNYWRARLQAMEDDGVHVFRGAVNYAGGKGQEKGVDIRIALDSIQMILDGLCDTLIIFSTDQDFKQIKPTALQVAAQMRLNIRVISAFPTTPRFKIRGIDGTEWIPFDRSTYNRSIDPQSYWPS